MRFGLGHLATKFDYPEFHTPFAEAFDDDLKSKLDFPDLEAKRFRATSLDRVRKLLSDGLDGFGKPKSFHEALRSLYSTPRRPSR